MKSLPGLYIAFRLGLLGALLAFGAWLSGLHPGDLSREFVQDGRRAVALERRRQSIRRYQAAQDRVVANLLAGGLTLRQAARQFAELEALLEDGGDGEVMAHQWPTGERALCDVVITRTLARLDGGPERAAAVLARLEEEYQRCWPGCRPTLPPELLPAVKRPDNR
jgi:hypothetical protein